MSSPESFKVVLVGESKVGKTCLCTQIKEGKFNPNTEPSTNTYLISKEIKLSDNSSISLEFVDTTGVEKYKKLSRIFTKKANAIILMYDRTNENSFKELKTFWYDSIKDFGAILFVVANKIDLDDQKVKDEEGKEFAERIGANFFSISVKDNIGISNLVDKIVETSKKK